MKTPEQIGRELADEMYATDISLGQDDKPVIIAAAIRAIKADRAQRDPNEDGTLHGAAIIALKERSFHAGDTEEGWRASDAIGWIEANPDEFWDEYAGPMLDEIERRAR